MTKFQLHKQRWEHCTDCPLCEGRQNVVLFRGSVPCDVLFVGEAPGQSEDVIGTPFVGPAGHLLDQIVEQALSQAGHEQDTGAPRPDGGWYSTWEPADLRIGYTNLIACIPLDETGSKVHEPPEQSIKACRTRLEEQIDLCKPKLVVCVGKLAKKYLPPYWEGPTVEIIHPAAILRAEVAQQTLLVRQAVVTLADAFGELE